MCRDHGPFASCSTLSADGLWADWQLQPRQIDACLFFVRRIVADPQLTIMKDESRVAGVAARRERDDFFERRLAHVEPPETRLRATCVVAPGCDNPPVGQL